ncbi:MAG: hypothetical protein HN742_42560 [Lentisphaerae bacterium]|jgi:hypothetical protein|nr:hypothetical protein [Lentisphaerota bacterium]MBT7056874.1 hypothetical protein [Lentisphaerota bacterium]MBT7848622.1 hypothetical protein [Lentisphaerota bacterium]
MTYLLRKLVSVLVLLLVLSIIFYFFFLRPRFQKAEDAHRTVEGLDNAVAGMQSTLNSLRVVPEEEVRLWKAIDHRLAATFCSGNDLASVVAGLSDVAEKAGASLVSVTFQEPGTGADSSAASTPSTPTRSNLLSAPGPQARSAGSTTRQPPASSRGTAKAASRPRPRPVPRKSSAAPPPSARGTGPRPVKGTAKGTEVAPNAFRAGAVTGVYHPATLQLTGDYASWTRFLSGCSKAYSPILIDHVEGAPGAEVHEMTVSIRIPAIASSGKGAAEVGGAASEPPAFSVSPAAGRLYHLDRLRDPLPAGIVPTGGDPFPAVRVAAPTIVPSRFRVSAILERNGEYVAVVNGNIVSVGDDVGGVTVLKITHETVIFSRGE